MRHIVVVEDDPVNAMLFQRLLERRGGFRVTHTEAPAEVLALAGAGADLILLDVSLRDSVLDGRSLSGVELCRLLKADPATAAVPVLLATAHAMRGDDRLLLERSGADGYVSKPILDHEAFIEQVRRALPAEAA